MNSVFVGTLFGVVSFVIGLFLVYTVKRRRFNRRGPGGLQHFRSFSGSLFTRLWEFVAMIVGVVLLLIGGMLIVERIYLEMQRSKKKEAAGQKKVALHTEMQGTFQGRTKGMIFSQKS